MLRVPAGIASVCCPTIEPVVRCDVRCATSGWSNETDARFRPREHRPQPTRASGGEAARAESTGDSSSQPALPRDRRCPKPENAGRLFRAGRGPGRANLGGIALRPDLDAVSIATSTSCGRGSPSSRPASASAGSHRRVGRSDGTQRIAPGRTWQLPVDRRRSRNLPRGRMGALDPDTLVLDSLTGPAAERLSSRRGRAARVERTDRLDRRQDAVSAARGRPDLHAWRTADSAIPGPRREPHAARTHVHSRGRFGGANLGANDARAECRATGTTGAATGGTFPGRRHARSRCSGADRWQERRGVALGRLVARSCPGARA